MTWRISTLCALVFLLAGCGDTKLGINLEKTLEGVVIDPQWHEVSPSYALNTDYLLLYFSAHWCPPCRGFTPKLVDFYHKENGGHLFQVLFVSADHTEREMQNYVREAKMPWPAVLYHSEATKKLRKVYGGQGIPRLVLLDRKGSVVADSFKGRKYLGPQHVLNELKKELDHRKADPAGLSETTGKILSTPEKLAKKFKVGGIAERGNRRIAMVNGKVYTKGDELNEGIRITDIAAAHVEIEKEGNRYRLLPE